VTPVAPSRPIILRLWALLRVPRCRDRTWETCKIKTFRSSILLILGIAVSLANGQKNAKKPPQGPLDQIDGKGFGHMGMFDAQIVVQSVENVIAVAEFDVPDSSPKPR
jgi:hypothetical protein